jgi:hypothetical protein
MKLESVENKSSVSFTVEDLALMQKVIRHLESCQCCKDALNDNKEAGYQPAPDASTYAQDDNDTPTTKSGSVIDG